MVDIDLDKLQFWKVEEGDTELAKKLEISFEKLFDNWPEGYSTELFVEDKEISPVFFAVGKDLDNLLGFASCIENEASDDVSDVSELFTEQGIIVDTREKRHISIDNRLYILRTPEYILRTPEEPGMKNYQRFEGVSLRQIQPKDLKNHIGYADYTGRGNLLHIVTIESFLKGKGVGSRLLDFVKSQDYELIEAFALREPPSFFTENGFIATGLANHLIEWPSVVWHNPKYKSQVSYDEGTALKLLIDMATSPDKILTCQQHEQEKQSYLRQFEIDGLVKEDDMIRGVKVYSITAKGCGCVDKVLQAYKRTIDKK